MFKIQPIFKDYIWGGNKLQSLYNKQCDLEVVAESWELSTHKDGQCIIATGPFKGNTLASYIEEQGQAVLGSKCPYERELPILIKLIDAKDNLSVQVHPDDAYAKAYEDDLGKTEMWIVLEAEEGAQLVYGLKKSMSKLEFEKCIKENKVEEVLNYVDVKKGDVFFIEPGTIHAIGKGIIIAEIQQSSNVTYRVYDYNRVGLDGKPRALHIDKAIEVSKLEACQEAKLAYQLEDHMEYRRGKIVECPYFKVEYIEVEEEIHIEMDGTSFHSILLTEGKIQVSNKDEIIELEKGESLFIPADNGNYKITGKGHFILSQL